MGEIDYEALDVCFLGDDEKVTLDHARMLIEQYMKQSLFGAPGAPIPDDVLEKAKTYFRDLGKQMGVKDTLFEVTDNGRRLEVRFVEVPAMRVLTYEVVVPDE